MPKGKFEYHEVPGEVVNLMGPYGEEITVGYRFEATGRGKVKVEHWQREERNQIFIDSYSVAEVLETIQRVSVGLEDARVHNEIEQGEYDGAYIKTEVLGWVAASEDEVAAVKRHVMAEWERSVNVAEQQRDAAEAKIRQLAYDYPDLVAQYAPRATAG